MKTLGLRLMFVFLCIGILLYLGIKINIISSLFGKEYIKYELVINEVMINNRSRIRDDEGDFEDWIEIYNGGNIDINLDGFGLTNKKNQPFLWVFPKTIIKAKSFCIVWISGKDTKDSVDGLHTSFKLKDKDKVIILTSPNNNWKDIFVLKAMGDNISYGKVTDGGRDLYGFDGGTPGKANISEVLKEGPNTVRLEGPKFSHNGGFYQEGFNLDLSTNSTNAIIYYTLDGSIPTEHSNKYTKAISILPNSNKATIVRSRVYKEGYPKSKVITQSYFVYNDIYHTYNIPVISLVTDPKNLFDPKNGIYVAGKIFDQWKIDNPNSEINQRTPANYNQRGKKWEREASIELIQPDGKVLLAQNIGIRIHGGFSRTNKLKSLALFPRKSYDDADFFEYDLFDGKSKNKINNKEINRFSKILLRTSATDSKHALFRDVFIQSLVESSMVLDIQSSSPAIVYINGEYYGIHNIREGYDKNYISSHYNINEEDVVIIKNPTGIAGAEIQEGYVGDEMHYNRIITYIKENNLRDNINYDFIKTQIDIDNFIEYNILQIYCDNRDWPGNNTSIWRKRTQQYDPKAPIGQDGRWRWLVFDLDYGFGLYQGEKAAKNNSLERATDRDGASWPNPPWSTLLLRSLLENDEFKNQFINIFADRLNTIFSAEVVQNKIDFMEKLYYPNITKHILRWNLHHNKIENWLAEIQAIKSFAIERPKYVYQHIVEYFHLSGTDTITIEMDIGGTVKINSLDIKYKDIPWNGAYFKDIPIVIEVIPDPDFIFVGWEGIEKSKDKVITISLSQASYLKAVFRKGKKN